MSKLNNLRCPQCGICYEGELVANEVDRMTCENCGSTTKLMEEDPDGLLSGAIPPLPRLLALAGVIGASLIALFFSWFSIIAIGILIYLAVEIMKGHKQQRADRIALWDLLKNSHINQSSKYQAVAKELARVNELLAQVSGKYGKIAPETRERLEREINSLRQKLNLLDDIDKLTVEKNNFQNLITHLKTKIISFEEEEMMQSFGIYKPLYNCTDSEAYKRLLEQIRDKQKEMIKNRKASSRNTQQVGTKGDPLGDKGTIKNLEKLIIRSFNTECESIIDKVTFSNHSSIESRLRKSFDDLNDLCKIAGISISVAYLNLKLEELHVVYEYQIKLKEEREEQRSIREEMREQAKLMKEIEDARKKIEKEETHFRQAIAELTARMELATTVERVQYEAKLQKYQEQLSGVLKDKEEVAFREQSTRAGYVYIISNIGSFGDNVYKIGMTRRLEPQERIDELGDASVPFEFDVHAMIFSENAPTLEGALHEHFADRTVNKANVRKEFFRVSLSEIEEVVRTHHNKVVEFTKLARAEDYRISLAKSQALAVQPSVA